MSATLAIYYMNATDLHPVFRAQEVVYNLVPVLADQNRLMSFYDGMIASVGQQLADATARLAVVRSCVRGCTGLIAELQAANHPLSAAERGLAKDLLFAAYFRHPRELAELDVRMANLNTELIRLRRVRSFVQAATDGIWRDFQEWSTRLVDAEARYPYTGELMTVDL